MRRRARSAGPPRAGSRDRRTRCPAARPAGAARARGERGISADASSTPCGRTTRPTTPRRPSTATCRDCAGTSACWPSAWNGTLVGTGCASRRTSPGRRRRPPPRAGGPPCRPRPVAWSRAGGVPLGARARGGLRPARRAADAGWWTTCWSPAWPPVMRGSSSTRWKRQRRHPSGSGRHWCWCGRWRQTAARQRRWRPRNGFRRRLVDETGLDPTPALADLEQLVAAGGVVDPGSLTGHQARRTDGRPAARPRKRCCGCLVPTASSR